MCVRRSPVIQTAQCLSVKFGLVKREKKKNQTEATMETEKQVPHLLCKSIVAASRSVRYPRNYGNNDYGNCRLDHFHVT